MSAPIDPSAWDAIMFDFDGVLVESVNVKTEAFAAMYREHGQEIEQRVVAHHLANGGMSRFDKFRIYQAEYLNADASEPTIDDLASRFAILVEDSVATCAECPGGRQLLDALSGRVPLFVISATPTEELQRIVKRRDLAAYFEDVRGAPRAKRDHILELLGQRGYRAERTLFIGDAMNDYNAAKAADVRFVGRATHGVNPFPPGTIVVDDMNGLIPRVS